MATLRSVLLALPILAAAAPAPLSAAPAGSDEPPTFDVESGCRSAGARAAAVADPKVCIDSEMRARETLKQEWPQFTAADRNVCVPLSRTGGMPTYTELLTCLETSRDVRRLRAENKDGLATGLRPEGPTGGGATTRGSGGAVSPSGVRPASPAPGASPGAPGSGAAGGGAGGSQ